MTTQFEERERAEPVTERALGADPAGDKKGTNTERMLGLDSPLIIPEKEETPALRKEPKAPLIGGPDAVFSNPTKQWKIDKLPA